MLALWVGVACAPRALPEQFPTTSAVRADAPAPRSPAAAVALAEDPPMPDVNTARWPGLAPDRTSAPEPHAHQHVMTMPDGTTMTMPDGMTMPSTAQPADAGAAPTDPHAGHHHAP